MINRDIYKTIIEFYVARLSNILQHTENEDYNTELVLKDLNELLIELKDLNQGSDGYYNGNGNRYSEEETPRFERKRRY